MRKILLEARLWKKWVGSFQLLSRLQSSQIQSKTPRCYKGEGHSHSCQRVIGQKFVYTLGCKMSNHYFWFIFPENRKSVNLVNFKGHISI